MKKLFVLILFVLVNGFVFSQKATIKGTVTDAGTGEAMFGVNIMLEGTTIGATTDFDGNFSFDCPPGKYKIKFSFISYDSYSEDISLSGGEVKEYKKALNEAALVLSQAEVVARANRESENLLLMERKKADKIQESIGAKELSSKGVSDAAGGVKKITGVSMIGSRQLFVRGLGDRYNKTQVNGMPMSSPNPDERLIPLDLFPVSVISAIDVKKTFAVDNYADYSGALIDINTKDYPEKSFLDVNYKMGINSQTSFNTFKQSNSEGSKYFGFDLNNRQNSAPENLQTFNKINERYFYSEEPFGTDWSYNSRNAAPRMSLGFTGGTSKSLKNNKSIGVIFSTSYGNDYATVNGNDLVLKADGTNLKSFVFTNYEYSTAFSNLLGFNFNTKKSKYRFNLIYLNNTSDELNDKTGYDGEGYNLFVRTMTYQDHRLMSGQLSGEHEIASKIKVAWNGAYSFAKSAEPDRRGVVYERNESKYGENKIPYQYYTLFTLNQGETLRYFSEMRDSTLAGGISFKYNLSNKEKAFGKRNIHFGLQGLNKNRNFDSFIYLYNVDAITSNPAGITNPANGIYQADPSTIDATVNINNEVFADSSVYIRNNTQDKDRYQAHLSILASYLELNYNVTSMLFVNAGVRAEYSNQTVSYFTYFPDTARLNGLDFFPAINVKYTSSDKSNIRLSASKTMTRADFLEMAPFRYRPSYGSATSFGNEEINHALNYNIDLKYELFPKPGELISIGVYGKMLNSPIERISRNQGGGIEYTFKNAKSGTVYGVELEWKKKVLERLSAGLNASYIYTQIEIDEESSNTFKTHAMMGASPYLINADAIYRVVNAEKVKLDAALIYNVYGRRIYAVGEGGKGDIYELPFNSLNLQCKMKLAQRWEFSLGVKNLLNAERKFVQDVVSVDDMGEYQKNGEKDVNLYSIGTWINIGIKYRIK